MQEQDERGRKSPTGPSPRSSAAQAPSGFDLEHRERSGCPGRLKSSLLDTHRVPLDVGELLRFEGASVHAEDQAGPSEAGRLLFLHEVGPSLLEVLLLSEEPVLEKLVLLESDQERPWKRPHGTGLLSGGPILYVSYRLSTLRLISVAEPSTTLRPSSSAAGWNLYRGSAVRPTPWRRPSSESSEDPPLATLSIWNRSKRGFSSPRTEPEAIRRGSGCTRASRWLFCRAMGRITAFRPTN